MSIVLGTLSATLGAVWLLANVTGNGVFALGGLAVPYGVRWFINFKLERERRLFSEQLAETLQVIASAMRAGQSFSGALAVAVRTLLSPRAGNSIAWSRTSASACLWTSRSRSWRGA